LCRLQPQGNGSTAILGHEVTTNGGHVTHFMALWNLKDERSTTLFWSSSSMIPLLRVKLSFSLGLSHFYFGFGCLVVFKNPIISQINIS
jgi:hypothetical protein